MSELPVPNDHDDSNGHLELVGKNPTTSEKHEALLSLVLSNLDDFSMSDEEVAEVVKNALSEHFAMPEFRDKDEDTIIRYILHSVLADAQIIASPEYHASLTDLDPDKYTDEEKRIVLQTILVKTELTDAAMAYIAKFTVDSDNLMLLSDKLEEFVESHNLYRSNVLRIFDALRKKLTGRTKEIIVASRIAKTMMYLMYEDGELVEPSDEA